MRTSVEVVATIEVVSVKGTNVAGVTDVKVVNVRYVSFE